MNSKTYNLTVENLNDKYPFRESFVLDANNWIKVCIPAFDSRTQPVLIENDLQFRRLDLALNHWKDIGVINYRLENAGGEETKTGDVV